MCIAFHQTHNVLRSYTCSVHTYVKQNKIGSSSCSSTINIYVYEIHIYVIYLYIICIFSDPIFHSFIKAELIRTGLKVSFLLCEHIHRPGVYWFAWKPMNLNSHHFYKPIQNLDTTEFISEWVAFPPVLHLNAKYH